MKVEKIKKISNQYSVIKQVYDDRILIRTNNIIYSKKYHSYMFLLTNKSCIWTWHVAKIVFGENQFNETFSGYLVELTKSDFDRVKTYNENFTGFSISKEDEIKTYEDLVKIAKEQENLEFVTKFID